MYKIIIKNCKNCGKEYQGNKKSVYCSLSCANKDNKTQFIKGIIPWNKNIKGKKSHSFGNKNAFGNKHSEETKIKIGKNGFHYGMLGKKHKKETRELMSEAHKGEKAYQWQGGITPLNAKIRNSIEMRLWREAVFARDNWTCQKTGIKGGELVTHHINNFADFPELRTSIENGITFSKKTHKEFHHIYGKKNNTKEQLVEFLLNYFPIQPPAMAPQPLLAPTI